RGGDPVQRADHGSGVPVAIGPAARRRQPAHGHAPSRRPVPKRGDRRRPPGGERGNGPGFRGRRRSPRARAAPDPAASLGGPAEPSRRGRRTGQGSLIGSQTFRTDGRWEPTGMIDRLISFLVALSLAFLVWLYARSREQESLDNVPVPVQISLAA